MKDEFDTQLEGIVKANADAFFSDLARDPQQREPAKMLEDFRKSETTEHAFRQFEEELELAATGRTGPAPRLRSERPDQESAEWKPGMDPDIGLDGGELAKAHGRRAARIEKSPSGWITEYD